MAEIIVSSEESVTPAKPSYQNIDLNVMITRVTILSDLAKAVAKLRDGHRAELERRMPQGTTLTAMDPQDELSTLGTVNLSNPRVEPYVTDRDAFDAYCRLRYPDGVETWYEFTDHEQVAAVLAEHAPHLLIPHRSVTDDAREAALRTARTADVPGTARRRGKPSLTVRPTTSARAAVLALFGGSPILRELAAGE